MPNSSSIAVLILILSSSTGTLWQTATSRNQSSAIGPKDLIMAAATAAKYLFDDNVFLLYAAAANDCGARNVYHR